MGWLVRTLKEPVDLKSNRGKSGSFGWAVIALYVVFHDVLAIRSGKFETLTRSCWKAIFHPKHRWWVYPLALGVTIHLTAEPHIRRAIHGK